MHIVYITFEFLEPIFSGNGTVSRLQVFELLKQGHEVLVICAQEKAAEVPKVSIENLTIHAIPILSEKTLGPSADYVSYCNGILANQEIIIQFDPHCIIVIDWHSSMALKQIDQRLQKPIFYQFFRCFSRAPEFFKTNEEYRTVFQFEKQLAQLAKQNLLLSKDSAQYVHQQFAVPTQILYPPLHPTFLQTFHAQQRVLNRRQLACDKEKTVQLIVICRISPEKEIERAITLVSSFSFRFQLTVYGESIDAHYFASLLKKVGDLHLTDKISFLGRKTPNEIIAALNASDIYLHSSSYEPFGLTIMEAALCGCLVVMDKSPKIGAGDLLAHEESCLKLNLDQPEQSATIITEFLNHPKKMDEMRKIAQDISRDLTVEKKISELLQIIGEETL